MTTSAAIVDETPPLHPIWRMDGNLRYEVAMNSIIITLNIAAILYINMRKHKIPVDDTVLISVICFGLFYLAAIIFSCGFWFMAMEEDESFSGCYLMGRIGHTLGFSTFLGLFFSISHHLALYFGLPCLLWFVLAMVAPCFPCLKRGDQAWWNFAKQT